MKGVSTAVVAAIIVGTLYFGREVFVPVALAILLSFVLAPLVRMLQRWHVPRGLAVVGVVLLAFVSIFALGGEVLLACWKADVDPATLRDSMKADAVATTLPEAVRLCLEAARNSSLRANLQPIQASATAA